MSSSGCCAIPPVARCPWSASTSMPMATCSTPSPPLVRWHHRHQALPAGVDWRNSPPWCPCRVMHLVRYGGCLAPHSNLRAPSSRRRDSRGGRTRRLGAPRRTGRWARLLKRVFAIDMERCPVCQQGTLRIIAAITERDVYPLLCDCGSDMPVSLSVYIPPLVTRAAPLLTTSVLPPPCAILSED